MAYDDNPQFLSKVTGLDGGDANGKTGELRRKYDFSERFTELAIQQTPFFRLVQKIGNKPTDDPQFKFTEKRQSWFKRYGYVAGASAVNPVAGTTTGVQVADAEITYASDLCLYMCTDYKNAGNITNVSGQATNSFKSGAVGTSPMFYLPKQIVKVNMSGTAKGGLDVSDYSLFQVNNVVPGILCVAADTASSSTAGDFLTAVPASVTLAANFKEVAAISGVWIKQAGGATSGELCSFSSDAFALDDVYSKTISSGLEPARSYIVGTSYEEGSGLLNKTWSDNPYSTGYGVTQIFRTEFGMTNTMRATSLKYEGNEWARVWRDKLIEHKWEIEQAALFSTRGSWNANIDGTGNEKYHSTQGAVDYVLNNGNIFGMELDTKTQDSFLDDMSQFLDPRYNNSNATLFFCDTATYNWLHKMGGYFRNNIELSPNYNADFAITGKRKMLGLDITTISTVYGDMNVVRNIHLDGSGIKILACNMKYVKWRPLMGNGVSRDTSVYVGVQTLENTGVDKRMDMILTEGGFEWQMPEAHAIWK